ncbi:CHAT domain-containing protein, partial [Vibrio cholerae]|nr:CHAT domain-containing protein [Vibrio cholerae]
MKLILRAYDETTLQLELEGVTNPVIRQISMDSIKISSLQQLCASYQAAINLPCNIDVLSTIGYKLFELLSHHLDVLEQWLSNVGSNRLEIRTALDPNLLQRLLLSLPWEVMVWKNKFLAADIVLYEVTRRVGESNPVVPPAKYKDMTLVFMAADPDFNSGLNYENEERAILQATFRAKNLNLWVEESGNLDRLIQRITESGHCDIAHISCHGVYDNTLKSFALLLEDDHYRPQSITASAFRGLAQHIQCLFLSACHSAETADTPAFAMELAKTGIANVIGWDGSVSDADATIFAANVYHFLLQQAPVPFACAAARQLLLQEHLRTGKQPHWHLGRVYLAPNGGWPLIDSRQPASPKRRGKSFHELLDRKKNVVPVASRETFVGRRKQTKEALRVFTENSAAGVLLTGIGGTGKSSLAARIVHRMEPQYKAAIIYKDYSEASILGELKQFVPSGSSNEDFQRYMSDIQQHPDSFADNLVDILEQHFSENPIILVVDDLEQHALEDLNTASATNGKVGVTRKYQSALRGVIEAFKRADTPSRLLLTSRHSFHLSDEQGKDLTEVLREIKVPDMNPLEQEKHWLALLQSGATTKTRDVVQDGVFLQQIWAICQGNPGLQDVLYQPLLKGEYEVLQTALNQLQAYHAGQSSASIPVNEDVDKYLQRIALEAYHAALTDTERQCLRVLSLFDFAIPEQLIVQATPKLGIEDAQSALQRLDNFGLLTYWQGEGLEGHLSCYGLARKIVMPLSKEDRHFITSICTPLLWHIWFANFLQKHHVPCTDSLSESLKIILEKNFPAKYSGELPLQTHQEQERLAYLNRLCIGNSLANWDELGFDSSAFIDLFELSLSLHTFEKLRLIAAAVDGLSSVQWRELYNTFNEEREKFKEIAKKEPQGIIFQLLRQFGGRPQLLTKGYQIMFGRLSDDDRKLMESIKIQNDEDRHLVGIQLAKTELQKAESYCSYADFLCGQKRDY